MEFFRNLNADFLFRVFVTKLDASIRLFDHAYDGLHTSRTRNGGYSGHQALQRIETVAPEDTFGYYG